ncbi:MAG TPA: N-acetylmuramoyl-L-alanine amidase [Candidatus Deferrimicrobiaceae bacterium]|nr:N-acetylmuramoyl-L-alanine amidase [Candidatus Deferrimicrobiaceae bacterium]
MRSLTRHLLAAAAAAFLLLPPHVFPSPARPAVVSDIRAWTNQEYTRVVIDLEADAKYEANFLRADPARNLPPRIFIDIHGADLRADIVRHPVEVNNGLLTRVRAGQYRAGVVRVVIDLERESGYRVFDLSDPSRIIVDVDGAAETGVRPVVPGRGGKIVVMLDPGHGGKDPGATGPTGLQEKDVVLTIGRMVREKLSRSPEYDIRMTRETDVYIPLEERTAMANQAGAGIFVSLHINASRNRRAEGISTYVLSRATDREALELAARENGVTVQKLSEVRFIIDDLSTYGRKKESLKLAKTVNDAIVRNISSRHGPVHDLGLKQAPFYVLVGARMTAVLVETSFISNRSEESRLRRHEYLETIADSVVEAIRYYGENAALARAGS